MSLPESLERAATQLPNLADQIRPANGDPDQLLGSLDPSEAKQLLVWVLAHEFDSAQELVDTWGEWEKGADVLLTVSDAALADEGVSKPGRKVIRKAHHRLRSRGIEVKAETASPSPPRRAASVEDPFEAAHLSAPDFRGAQIGYLADRHPAGGARLFEIRFDDARGIVDFRVYNAGRSKVRGFLRSLSAAEAQRLFDVPRVALCALIRRASLAQPADRPLPGGFMEWRGRIFNESLEEEPTPGGLVRAEVEKSGALPEVDASVEALIAAIMDGAAGPWPPASSWVSERMDEGRERVVGLEGGALEAGVDEWITEVAGALGAGEDSGLLARRLEELAWVRRQTDGIGDAATLIVAADAIVADEALRLRLAKARVESLFAPFLGELRTAA